MISLVLVAHRSSRWLPGAVESFRAEAATLGVPAEVVVVEQSEDVEEAARAEVARPERFLIRENRGYAAGLNAGMAAASGEILLLGNPDVRFHPGSLGALLAGLEEGWDVVGPQFVLAGWLFPPADVQTPGEELRRYFASRSARFWDLHHRREARRWAAVWESPAPVEAPALSGALVAVRAETAARIGPWDEGYFLYFEETSWLRRARAMGRQLAVVPAARVEHAWGHAAGREPAAAHFGPSRRRYYEHSFGLLGTAIANLRLDVSPLDPPAFAAAEAARFRQRALWLLSPSPLGFPAAGLWSESLPLEEIRGFSRACPQCASLVLIAYDARAGRRLGIWRVEAAAVQRGDDRPYAV
ncbi:MAG TPA: glycosyltransferase family 2 protein [Thermoanaerobaculia bacterium]|nr:glycosyltransferase family 2 protein [Thermoanaerobaculia bacterium]